MTPFSSLVSEHGNPAERGTENGFQAASIKIKEDENFNHRNTLSISRIKI